jgi:hypothetical protein
VEWAGGTAPTSRELFPDVPKELMHDHDHGHALHDHHHDDHDHPHGHRHTHTHQKDEVLRSGEGRQVVVTARP